MKKIEELLKRMKEQEKRVIVDMNISLGYLGGRWRLSDQEGIVLLTLTRKEIKSLLSEYWTPPEEDINEQNKNAK